MCLSLIIHVHPTMPIHRFSKYKSLTWRIFDCPHSPQNVGWIGTAYFDHLRVINELLGLWSQSTSKIMHRVKHVVKVCPGLSNRWKVITETMLKLSLNTPVYGILTTDLYRAGITLARDFFSQYTAKYIYFFNFSTLLYRKWILQGK